MDNLKEKVYLLLYCKPNYKTNISNILYGKDSKTINRIWKELEQEKPPWIIPKKTTVNRIDGKIDGRSWSQKNCISSAKPLFMSICNDLKEIENNLIKKHKIKRKFLTTIDNIILTDTQKKALLKVLESNIFREFVNSIIKKFGEAYNYNNHLFCLSLIKKQLAYLCVLFLCSELFFGLAFSSYSTNNNNKIYEEQLERFLKIRMGNFQKKRKFKKISDLILSLNIKTLEKLSYLDYTTSQILIPYLIYFNRVNYESVAEICNMIDDDEIIHDLYPSFNLDEIF